MPNSVNPAVADLSNCYVFKSRLQEYAQKVGISRPSYETIREGPSHEPTFRSTVIVGGDSYGSLPGFTNRKAAEQSAAEVALMALSKSGDSKESISVPVHETGLCKNLLQEYAQKMNYAIPTYVCQKDDTRGRTPIFSCTVDIGGIQYIGAAARTRKEAEIKAAKTALLAIQSSGSMGGELYGKTQCTVVPCKRKVPETAPPQAVAKKAKKPRKRRIKKKPNEQMHPGFIDSLSPTGNMAVLASKIGTTVADQQEQEGFSDVQVPVSAQIPLCSESLPQVDELMKMNEPNGLASVGEGCVGPQVISNLDGSQWSVSSSLSGNVNIVSADPAVLSTNTKSSGDYLKINTPPSVQLNALLLGSSQGRKIHIVSHTEQEENNDHGSDDISSSLLGALCTGSGAALQQGTADAAEVHCHDDISSSLVDALCTGSGDALQWETTDAAEVHKHDNISSNLLDALCTGSGATLQQGTTDAVEVHRHGDIPSDLLDALCTGSGVELQQGTTDAAEVRPRDEISSNPLDALHSVSEVAVHQGTTDVAKVHCLGGPERND